MAQPTTYPSTPPREAAREVAREGGVATWACLPGFPPAVIFPFTPAERYGMRSLQEFQKLMYRPLYWLGPDGGAGVDTARSLAELPVWAADGRSCTIRIKPWKWSDGETVCADNVMFWMNMLVRKARQFGAYTEGFFPDNLSSYEKVSEDTVRFTFDAEYSQQWLLLNQLSTITPMPKAWDRTADGPADATHDPDQAEAVYDYLMAENGDPVAESHEHRTRWPDSPVWSVVNGPWRLTEFTADGHITMVPNPSYSGPVKPRLAEFRQVPIESDEQQYELLRAGPKGPDAIQVGYLPLSYGTQPGDDPTVGGPNPLGEQYRLVPQCLFTIGFMAVNFGNPTVAGHMLRQTYVRRALQSCMDQDFAARDVYQGYGWSQSGPIPMVPDTGLVSPRLADGRGLWSFDVDRARELLAANGWDVSVTPAVCVRPDTVPGEAGAGIPEGTPLSILLRYMAGRPALDRIMERFRDDAAKAGIELRLSAVVGSVLVAEDGPGPDKLWELSCWGGGWVYDHPTGENLFQSGAACNFSNYADPRADELIARTITGDDLQALYEYQEYISDQLPVIFTPTFPRRLYEVDSTLRGFTPINPYGLITPEDWYYVTEER